MIINFLDKETNGFRGTSVLSVTMWKYFLDTKSRKLVAMDLYNRFYLPLEKHNPHSAKVHGLWPATLVQKREGQGWPTYFPEDAADYAAFLNDVDLNVAHNFAFDSSFATTPLDPGFCTMETLKGVVPVFTKTGAAKKPSLAEACSHYGIVLKDAHTSLGDVKALVRVFAAMLGDDSPAGETTRRVVGLS